MKLRLFAFALALAAVLATASAQGPKGQPGGNPNPPASTVCPANPLDLSQQKIIEGAITSIDLGYGVQYPSIVVNKQAIKIAPVWFLLENDFELGVGDQVKVTAVPSTAAGDAYLYALEITKTAVNSTLALRNATGQPLWLAENRRAGNQTAPRLGTPCIDPASIKSVTGAVDSVTAGIGVRQPVVVIKSGDTLVTIKLGPERILLDADFEIKAGMTLTVKYALATCTDEFVALSLTDSAGHTIVLRNDDGSPAWNNGR